MVSSQARIHLAAISIDLLTRHGCFFITGYLADEVHVRGDDVLSSFCHGDVASPVMVSTLASALILRSLELSVVCIEVAGRLLLFRILNTADFGSVLSVIVAETFLLCCEEVRIAGRSDLLK